MPGFQTQGDIANRALGRCGLGGNLRITNFNTVANGGDDTKECSETYFVYDKLRVAELRRNVWRFSVRLAVLRPIQTTSMAVTFGAWSSVATYNFNDVVVYNGVIYYSKKASNTDNTPGTDFVNWAQYFGPTIASPISYAAWSNATTYQVGALVSYNGTIYVSIIQNNLDNTPGNAGNSAWSVYNPPAFYYAGELVYDTNNVVYLSLTNNNTDMPPSANWRTLTTQPTIESLNFIYPAGAGPSTEAASRNVFILPNGFMREAPQDPKAGSVSFLGAPTGLMYDDWTFQDNYFTSRYSDPIVFRFAADVENVLEMDPMFCEGLGCRIALEVVETLTQSTAKLQSIASLYKEFMTEARTVNGIEEGPTEPPEDEFITCRI